MSKLSMALTVALVAGAATASLAQQATATATAQTSSTQTQITANVDTWIEGTVLSLDADGQKFSVRGVKLPYATAEAGMMKDIAEQTKDLEPAKRDAKIAEIKQSWADKLNKAKAEQLATSSSDFNFSLPDKASLVILDDQAILRQADGEIATKVNAEASSTSASAATAKSETQVPQSSVDAAVATKASGQATAGTKADAFDAKETAALRTLKDLKVGDKIKVGFDAGLLSNTAHVIVADHETAVR